MRSTLTIRCVAMMSIHRDIKTEVNEVVRKIALSPRKFYRNNNKIKWFRRRWSACMIVMIFLMHWCRPRNWTVNQNVYHPTPWKKKILNRFTYARIASRTKRFRSKTASLVILAVKIQSFPEWLKMIEDIMLFNNATPTAWDGDTIIVVVKLRNIVNRTRCVW